MIPAREYIFVVDVSGSMHGFPLDTAKLLLEDLISSLQPTDTFNVLFFAGGSEVMAESSVPASPEQIRRAVKMIGNSNGGGGTELLKAMNRAMALPKQEAVSRTIIVVTDGYISAERDVFESIEKNLEHTNVFAFGIGSSVNRFLVEGMARSGQGEPFVVTTPEQAGPAAQKFRQYISNPVLTDIKIAFHGLDFYDVEPRGVPDLFGERPVVVYGKWRGEPSGTIELSGSNSEGKYLRTIQVKEIHQEDSTAGLDYLWARSRINRISDFNPRKTDTERRKEIVSLGLTYNLLTAFTSFVAVDEVVRNPEGGAKDVRQPLTLPKGVSNLAVSGGMRKVPEPGILALFVLTLAYLLLGVMQKRVHALNIRKWRGTR
jgi:Ca-activated chloride channel family protein